MLHLTGLLSLCDNVKPLCHQCLSFRSTRIQDAGVRQVVEGPSGARLREINLTNCVRVSDVTLLRIAQR